MRRLRQKKSTPEQVGGNGLIDRRLFLAGGAAPASGRAQADPLPVEPYMRTPGAGFSAYGQPSQHEGKVGRIFASAPGTTGTGASRTPLHLLDGIITPNGLHFERHHAGIPDIDPDAHRLLIHGLVKRSLIFTLDAMMR